MKAARDFSVFPVLLFHGQHRVVYLPIRALEGVIAPGKRVEVGGPSGEIWRSGMVVEPWDHPFGSAVCVKLDDAP